MERYAGTGLLTRMALRHDRVLVGVWIAVLTLTVYVSAAATGSLYPTVSDRVAAAEGINASPATIALYGPILDTQSRGELAMTKMTVLYAVLVALLAVVVVRRHTRTEEETGSAELIGGTAVGQDTPLAAAVLEGALLSVAVGVLAALADLAGGLPVSGSLLFGASWVGTGLVAVGVTAVACQVSASSRTCGGLAIGAIGALYAVRAVADTGPVWLGWASPFGWSTRLSAWSEPRPWVLLLYAAATLALAALARALRARRDVGSGLVGVRPGPAHGARRLATVMALTWRVNRAAGWSWTAGAALLGLAIGAIAPGIGSLLDTPAARDLIERIGGIGALQDTLVGAVLSIAAVLVTCFGLSVVAHAGADERAGRTEEVLATGTSRTAAFVATALVALAGATWLLLVTGVTVAVGIGVQGGGDGATPSRLVAAALGQAPAVWVVVALALLLYAVRSRWAVAGWVVLAACFVVGQLGRLLELPGPVTGLSPYSHVPAMPVEPFAAAPALVMACLSVVLVAVAWWRFRERGIG